MEPKERPTYSYIGSEQIDYDNRIVKNIQILVNGYKNIDFNKYFDEAYIRYRFIEKYFKDYDIISGITSWDTFIERLNDACRAMQNNLWEVDSITLERKRKFDKTTACFLIMCKYVIENHSPNGDYAKKFFNSFMSSATIGFEPRYNSTSSIENVRAYDKTVPLGIVSVVHKSAHELEGLIYDDEFLMGIFETESIRNRVVRALAESPVMTVVLLRERDLNNVPRYNHQNSELNASYASGNTYLSWLTRVKKDDSVDILIKEMKILVVEILKEIPIDLQMPLNDFISSIGGTEKTLAALNKNLKHICSTGYFLNEFSTDELMELLDVELIAGGILEMCKETNIREDREDYIENEYIVYEAQNVLDLTFMRSNLILQVVQRIMQNEELFKKWWGQHRPQFLKQNNDSLQKWRRQHQPPLQRNFVVKPTSNFPRKPTTRIDGPVIILPTYKTITKDSGTMIQIIADFLKIKPSDYMKKEVKTMVIEFFKNKSDAGNKRKNREESLEPTVDNKTQKTEEGKLASTSNIVGEPPTEPLSDKEIQAREAKITDSKKVLTDIVDVSRSYLAWYSQSFGPYFREAGSNFANIITNIISQGSTRMGAAYNSAKSFMGNVYNNTKNVIGDYFNRNRNRNPNRIEWKPIHPKSLKLLTSGVGENPANSFVRSNVEESNVSQSSSAGVGGNSGIYADSSNPLISSVPTRSFFGKPNDLSKRELKINSNSNSNMYFVPEKTGGAGPFDSTSESPPPPARVHPTREPVYDEKYRNISNLHHVPDAGGSRAYMESNSINPNNVKDRTSTSSNINSINFSYERPDIYGKESLEPTPSSSRASSPERENSIKSTRKKGGKPRHSMSKNKKTLRRNPRKLISRRQKYSRRK